MAPNKLNSLMAHFLRFEPDINHVGWNEKRKLGFYKVSKARKNFMFEQNSMNRY